MIIVAHITTLAKYATGWTKEFNLVDWDGKLRFDLRDWSPGYTQCSRGLAIKDLNVFLGLLKGEGEHLPSSPGSDSEALVKIKHIADLGDDFELNITSMCGSMPKFDIRKWIGDKYERGITLHEDEFKVLISAIKDLQTDNNELHIYKNQRMAEKIKYSSVDDLLVKMQGLKVIETLEPVLSTLSQYRHVCRCVSLEDLLQDRRFLEIIRKISTTEEYLFYFTAL